MDTQECNDYGSHMNTCFDKISGYKYATGNYYYDVYNPTGQKSYTSGRMSSGDVDVSELNGNMDLDAAVAACDNNESCTGFYFQETDFSAPQRNPRPTEAVDVVFTSGFEFQEDVFGERYHSYVKDTIEYIPVLELPDPEPEPTSSTKNDSMGDGAIVGLTLGAAALVGIVAGITLGAFQYSKVRKEAKQPLSRPLVEDNECNQKC